MSFPSRNMQRKVSHPCKDATTRRECGLNLRPWDPVAITRVSSTTRPRCGQIKCRHVVHYTTYDKVNKNSEIYCKPGALYVAYRVKLRSWCCAGEGKVWKIGYASVTFSFVFHVNWWTLFAKVHVSQLLKFGTSYLPISNFLLLILIVRKKNLCFIIMFARRNCDVIVPHLLPSTKNYQWNTKILRYWVLFTLSAW